MNDHKTHSRVQSRPTRATTHRIAFFCLCLTLTAGLWGCASSPTEEMWSWVDLELENQITGSKSLPSEKTRTQFGTIGVVYKNSNAVATVTIYRWSEKASDFVSEWSEDKSDVANHLYEGAWKPHKRILSDGLFKHGFLPGLIEVVSTVIPEVIGTALSCLVKCPVLVLAPVASGLLGLEGVIAGTVTETPEATAQKIETQLEKFVSIPKIHKTVGSQIIKVAQRETGHPILLIGDQHKNWKTHDAEIFLKHSMEREKKSRQETHRLNSATLPKVYPENRFEDFNRNLDVEGRGESLRFAKLLYNNNPPWKVSLPSTKVSTLPLPKYGYEPLTSSDIDTILEISVWTISFIGVGGSDPNLKLFFSLRARLVRERDDKELYSHTLDFSSVPRKYSVWSAKNGRVIRKELQRAGQNFAETIVEEVFIQHRFE